jgi:hypothetical protein
MSAKDILNSFTKVHISVIALASAMSALGGAALGAKIALDKLGQKIMKDADEALKIEIAKAKEYYKTQYKAEEFATPEQALEALHPVEMDVAAKALAKYQGIKLDLPEEIPAPLDMVPISKNVFTDAAYIREPFDYEAELRRRDPDGPYLITEEEYLEAGPQYEQVSFTYYAGDGVLTNVSDEVIDNIEGSVGSANLLRFGDGSNDENVVYVRNCNLEMDIELTQSAGKYSVEVAGFDDENELRHSDVRRSPRRFRQRDE